MITTRLAKLHQALTDSYCGLQINYGNPVIKPRSVTLRLQIFITTKIHNAIENKSVYLRIKPKFVHVFVINTMPSSYKLRTFFKNKSRIGCILRLNSPVVAKFCLFSWSPKTILSGVTYLCLPTARELTRFIKMLSQAKNPLLQNSLNK